MIVLHTRTRAYPFQPHDRLTVDRDGEPVRVPVTKVRVGDLAAFLGRITRVEGKDEAECAYECRQSDQSFSYSAETGCACHPIERR